VKRILFVDDENRILDGIRRMLYSERNRWRLEFAQGGEAALAAMQAGGYDVIVSDMRMPGMDGAELLTQVKDRWPATIRMILSGYTETEAAMRAVPVAHRFLAKPCNADALREAIERSCALQEVLNSSDLRRVVSGLGDLPSVSNAYARLTDALTKEDVGIDDVARIIATDMAMSARVLQFANNAFFGAPQGVSTVLGAVSYLGINTIKNLVLTAEIFRAFPPNQKVPNSFWESVQSHAIRCAAIAGKLPLEKQTRDAAFLAALLHDIGCLVLAAKMPDQFASVLAESEERACKHFLVEEERLGVSHAEIGAYLLGLWGLPHVVVEAIAHHHRPTRVPHSGVDPGVAVFVADLLAEEQASPEGERGALAQHDQNELATLGLTAQFEEWRESTLNSGNALANAPE
jgi:putative nucleotidyltransferase with HDIG domain